MKLNYVIRNGTLVDGTGTTDSYKADIGIQNDKIVIIGDIDNNVDAQNIDASGCYVSPGFIDVHSHSDAYILIEPSAASKVHQGVTTEVVGQCGASAAPLCGEYKMPSDWREMKYPGSWHTLSEYRALLEEQSPALNIMMLTGHNTLRAGVMGYTPRPANPDELDRMTKALEEALQSGSTGLSTGLLYPPGKHAQLSEIIHLCKTVQKYDGVYATHMRSEGDQLLEALEETIRIARESGVRLQISHLKVSGRENWDKLDRALEMIEQAQSEGIEIKSDRYPYTAACTDLDVLLPDWVFANGPQQELEWLLDPAMQKKIRKEVAESRSGDYWETVFIGSTFHPDNESYKGKPLLEVADQLGRDPIDTVLQLLMKDTLKTGGIFFGMNEENMWRILSQPYVMIGSDASLRAPTGPLSNDHPHPRAYGSFSKFLRAALDGKTVSLTNAIHKMTGLPAKHFNMHKRGLLKDGFFADLTIFTPQVRDHATYENPHAPATGIRAVFVNGIPVIQSDKLTHKRGGIFLNNPVISSPKTRRD